MTPTDEIDSHIKSLKRLRDMAMVTRKIGPAISAECAIGRVLLAVKADVEQGPMSIYQMTDDELLEIARGGRRERHDATT